MNYTICIEWSIPDVQAVLENGEVLTNEQCAQVLQLVKRTHDAEIGVNWHTIRAAAQVVLDEVRK